MKVKELGEKLGLSLISGENNLEREVKNCFIGDLLSHVMSHAQSGDVWITVQGNINVIAVASLTDCAMVIICEGMALDEAAKKKAELEEIPVFTSDKSAYNLACGIKELI